MNFIRTHSLLNMKTPGTEKILISGLNVYNFKLMWQAHFLSHDITNGFGLILIIVKHSVHILEVLWKVLKFQHTWRYSKHQILQHNSHLLYHLQNREKLNLQLWTFGYIWLLKKPYENENEVTLRGQKISFRCWQHAELLMYIERGFSLSIQLT